MGWLIALWIFLAIAALVALIIFLPVGIRVRYHRDELKLWYTVGPIRLLRYPEDVSTHEKRKNSKLNLRTVLDEPIKANRKYDNVIGDFWAELKTTLELFWYLRPKLRIKRLVLKLHLGGADPAALALQYGGAWASILKKRELNVDCDFNADGTTLDAKLDITIGLGRLILCLVQYSMNTLNKTEKKQPERR